MGLFPSDDEMDSCVEANCVPAFGDYVGVDHQDLDARLRLADRADRGGWNDGDHSVQCALIDPANAELTESLKDAAR